MKYVNLILIGAEWHSYKKMFATLGVYFHQTWWTDRYKRDN